MLITMIGVFKMYYPTPVLNTSPVALFGSWLCLGLSILDLQHPCSQPTHRPWRRRSPKRPRVPQLVGPARRHHARPRGATRACPLSLKEFVWEDRPKSTRVEVRRGDRNEKEKKAIQDGFLVRWAFQELGLHPAPNSARQQETSQSSPIQGTRKSGHFLQLPKFLLGH